MEKFSVPASLFLCCLIGGCATPQAVKTDNAQSEVDTKIFEASRRIERMQLQLVGAGAIDPTVKIVRVGILDKGRAISVSWKGDAFPLLQMLVAERGLAFDSSGVRLPLPVAIDVQNQPFDTVLEAIRAQTGYRAIIVNTPEKVTLQFNRTHLLEGGL
jgi:defect-in-organelle-trafficking protein DotD